MDKEKKINFSVLEAMVDSRLADRLIYQAKERPLVKAVVMNATYHAATLRKWLKDNKYSTNQQDWQWLDKEAIAANEQHWTIPASLRMQLLKKFAEKGEKEVYNLRKEFKLPGKPLLVDQYFGDLLNGKMSVQQIEKMSADQLRVLLLPLKWLANTPINLELRWLVGNNLERIEFLAPLQRNTVHFKGRIKELAILHEFAFSRVEHSNNFADPLLVYGIGGIGKSALVSKFILQELTGEAGKELPFVYLDFDRAGLSIAEPLLLAIEALRQLMLQFPVAPTEEYDPLRSAREELISFVKRGEDSPNYRASKKQVSRGNTRAFILSSIAKRYLTPLYSEQGVNHRPVIVVFDSFEEAQFRSSESELQNLLNFVQEIGDYLPNVRLMIVGRSDLVVAPFKFQLLEVTDFDKKAAIEYLKVLEINKADIRDLIYERVGGNPLNLKLAAALARKENSTLEGFSETLSKTQVREWLIRRNIHHIPDQPTQLLTVPGMLVRRITPDVIQHVLGPASKLGQIDHLEATRIFSILSKLTFLTEQHRDLLFFRRDLRNAMRNIISDDQPRIVKRLHELARDYYQDKTAPFEIAEYIFHQLQLSSPEFLENSSYDFDKLRPFLENALHELPPDAAAALGRHFKLRVDVSVPIGNIEWERSMASDIENGLKSGLKEEDILRTWEEIEDHPGEDLDYQYNRIVLAIRLGFFEQAQTMIETWGTSTNVVDTCYLTLMLGNYSESQELILSAIAQLQDVSPEVETRYLEFITLSFLLVKWTVFEGLKIEDISKGYLTVVWNSIPDHSSASPSASSDGNNIKLTMLPLRYQALQEKPSQRNSINDASNLLELIQLKNILKQEEFIGMYNRLFDQIQNHYRHATLSAPGFWELLGTLRAWEEETVNKLLFNNYQVLVSDISEAGVWKVVTHDIADYLVAYHAGDLTEAWRIFGKQKPTRENAPRSIEEDDFLPKYDIEINVDQDLSLSASNDLSELKEKVRNLISGARLKEALKLLQTVDDEDIVNTVVLQSGRLNRLENSFRSGTISDSDASVERNRITMAILRILEDL